jgi:hypothetical protein
MSRTTHAAVIGGCTRTQLISDATAEGRKARNAVRRGDVTAETAFDLSNVGYPYMSAAEYTAAKAAFIKAAR